MPWMKLAGFVFAVLVMELVLSYGVGFIPGSETFKGVILGALIAGTVGIGGELLRGERDSRLDSVKRSNDRKIESDRFQRENMLQLQDDLAASANMSDVQTRARIVYRAHGVLDNDLRAALLAFEAKGDAHQILEMQRRLGIVLRRYLEPPS